MTGHFLPSHFQPLACIFDSDEDDKIRNFHTGVKRRAFRAGMTALRTGLARYANRSLICFASMLAVGAKDGDAE
jgi:hypothetical protein